MLELPQKFQNDIQGKDTHLIPLINIDDRIYLSTNKISLDNNYIPLVKDLGSVKESIDVAKKNFKISSVSLSFYNYEYNDSYLSHQLFTPSVMNKKMTIYLKSQSADSIDDCLLVYSGYIKDIKENADLVSIEIEDRTESTLHKDLPMEFVKDDIDLPDKYKNKRVPIVYGFVDKAPCVYYNLYGSALENGSTKYSITPDSFAIGSITNPSVLDNDIYLTIRENATLFASQSQDTLYASGVTEQYYIFYNMILVDKYSEVNSASNEVQTSIGNTDTSPTGYNYVEVENTSDVVFSGGSYNLYYQLNDGLSFEKKTIPIKMYKDIEGTTPSTDLADEPYLDVKDFSDVPEVFANPEYWFWGNNDVVDSVNYNNIYGESLINFEAKDFCSENSVLKTLTKNDNSEKEIKSLLSLEWGLEAEIDPIYTTGSILPNLRFKWVDASAGIWDIDSTDAINDIYSNSGETDNRTTKNISNNLFSIGQRQFYQESWNLIDQNGAMKYLKVKNLKLKRTAILKDFIKYDIYANVSGRVDNIAGTYTGTPQFTSEERQNYYEGRTRETGITAYKPIKAPIKAPIQQVKPTQIKPVIAKPLAITNLKIKKDSKY
tara:strand:+ start:5108 stop:6916 length:1809 start_codon:yes stop_codon:yes gene_type:complete